LAIWSRRAPLLRRQRFQLGREGAQARPEVIRHGVRQRVPGRRGSSPTGVLAGEPGHPPVDRLLVTASDHLTGSERPGRRRRPSAFRRPRLRPVPAASVPRSRAARR
jgi:hypothetical protein